MAATHDYAGIAANNDIKTVDSAKIKSYADCEAFWNAHEGSMRKVRPGQWEMPLASNVTLTYNGMFGDDPHAFFKVKLYGTDIVTYWLDETFMASNGGYNTPTTSRRISQFAPGGFYYHEKKQLRGYGANERVPCKKPSA